MKNFKSILSIILCVLSLNTFSQIRPITISIPGSSTPLSVSSENFKLVQNDLIQINLDENANQIPTWGEIKAIATKNELFVYRELNSHLRYTDGDISFWDGEQFPKKEIERKFRAMKEVLKIAENQNILIPTKGDLTGAAERIIIEIKMAERKK
jgi:hypothetical protein